MGRRAPRARLRREQLVGVEGSMAVGTPGLSPNLPVFEEASRVMRLPRAWRAASPSTDEDPEGTGA